MMSSFSIKTACALALLMFSVACLAADGRPNVVVIITDDQNAYGFYDGYPGTQVPAMDRLKESAVTFERAYTAAPVCGPSRAAFFSGLYPHSTGAYKNGGDPWRKTLAAATPLSGPVNCSMPSWPMGVKMPCGTTMYFMVVLARSRGKKTSFGKRERTSTAAPASSGG